MVSVPFLIPSGICFLGGTLQLPLPSPNSATEALSSWEGSVSPWPRRKQSADLFSSRATSIPPPPSHVTEVLMFSAIFRTDSNSSRNPRLWEQADAKERPLWGCMLTRVQPRVMEGCVQAGRLRGRGGAGDPSPSLSAASHGWVITDSPQTLTSAPL